MPVIQRPWRFGSVTASVWAVVLLLLVYVFTPQLVLLGGGLAGAARHFLPSVRREVESRVQAVSREGLRIEAACLGNGAGRLGAARLALQRLNGMMAPD